MFKFIDHSTSANPLSKKRTWHSDVNGRKTAWRIWNDVQGEVYTFRSVETFRALTRRYESERDVKLKVCAC